jgi:hypothetical protein
MRTVKTTSGATAVQVVWSWRRGSREIEVEALKSAAQQRIAAGQLELDLGLASMFRNYRRGPICHVPHLRHAERLPSTSIQASTILLIRIREKEFNELGANVKDDSVYARKTGP